MNRQRFRLPVLEEAKDRAEKAYQDAKIHQREAAQATEAIESDLGQVRNLYVSLARMQRGYEECGQRNRCTLDSEFIYGHGKLTERPGGKTTLDENLSDRRAPAYTPVVDCCAFFDKSD
jgi:hypothetical protein